MNFLQLNYIHKKSFSFTQFRVFTLGDTREIYYNFKSGISIKKNPKTLWQQMQWLTSLLLQVQVIKLLAKTIKSKKEKIQEIFNEINTQEIIDHKITARFNGIFKDLNSVHVKKFTVP